MAMQPPSASSDDPDQAIGYIDPGVSQKVKTYLMAAQPVVLNEQTAQALKQLLSQGNDPAMAIATLIGKIIDSLETKLGPLEQQEHDQVAVHIAGWIVSSLQKMGMPGLDQQDGRHDMLGRILQALDQLTGGQGQSPDQGQPPQQDQSAAPQQDQGAPLAQFGGQ